MGPAPCQGCGRLVTWAEIVVKRAAPVALRLLPITTWVDANGKQHRCRP